LRGGGVSGVHHTHNVRGMAVVVVPGPAEKELSDEILHAYPPGLGGRRPHDRQHEGHEREGARRDPATQATRSAQAQWLRLRHRRDTDFESTIDRRQIAGPDAKPKAPWNRLSPSDRSCVSPDWTSTIPKEELIFDVLPHLFDYDLACLGLVPIYERDSRELERSLYSFDIENIEIIKPILDRPL
jgi:hypothetical protein